MKMTQNFENEMGYVRDLLSILRKNHYLAGDVFRQRTLIGQPCFGHPSCITSNPTCIETLDAMERRGLILAIDKVYTWEDGTEVTMENMHAGEVYQTITYKVMVDNFEDYFDKVLIQVANMQKWAVN